jgi:hypothetical protein
MQSVGFKEWALVCEALGRGEQTILLRKGGIAEGREGFGFRHSEFFLLPTFFHEQVVKVRTLGAEVPAASNGEIHIRYFAKLEAQKEIKSWSMAAGLEPFHILQESVVRERFDYKGAGLHVALVRVFRLALGWTLADKPAYGGCRSWVELPECPAGMRFEPVLTDREYKAIAEKFRAITVLEPARPRAGESNRAISPTA